MSEAFESTVQLFQRLFSMVLALAMTEAFKHFVADKAEAENQPTIYRDRGPALVAFLLLFVPFFHGLNQFFRAEYFVDDVADLPSPYSLFLLIDTIVFSFQAALFFVMSRALPFHRWRPFYNAVLGIFVIDTVWSLSLLVTQRDVVVPWLINSIVSSLVLACILRSGSFKEGRCEQHAPYILVVLVLLRTVADYAASWNFYFPSP